ncbi:hypothetical protein BJY59DRAFT_187529 [Rhodotorula toruloides]
MAIAPIHGMLRRSAIKHVTLGISSGLAGGYIFWYGWHIPQAPPTVLAPLDDRRRRLLDDLVAVRRRDEWYLEQERRKQAGEA